jgi:hypothetical protein
MSNQGRSAKRNGFLACCGGAQGTRARWRGVQKAMPHYSPTFIGSPTSLVGKHMSGGKDYSTTSYKATERTNTYMRTLHSMFTSKTGYKESENTIGEISEKLRVGPLVRSFGESAINYLFIFYGYYLDASPFVCSVFSPFATSGIGGIGIGPPGEFSNLAVRTSTPVSVTRRVCSMKC